MKLFGIHLGKEKPVNFDQFRDMVRLTVRRQHPSAVVENNDNGFVMRVENKPYGFNLRQLYFTYCKAPHDRERLIREFVSSISFDQTPHTWSEVVPLLRPCLRSRQFLEQAKAAMKKDKTGEDLPATELAGDLFVTGVVQLTSQIAGVTQGLLDGWGVTIDEVLDHGLRNLNMENFPNVVNSLTAGGTARGAVREEVGLVFEGNHLTATWLVSERFRDYLSQRLQGSYVVAVPCRSKLTAVRADEAGLISNIVASNRNLHNLSYSLTGQLYLVDASVTGGTVSVYQPGGGRGEAMASDSLFAAGKSDALPTLSHVAMGIPQNQSKELNNWFGLNEPNEESNHPSPAAKRGPNGKK